MIPLRNGGAGIALTVGLPLLVEDCLKEPAALPEGVVGRLGTYTLPSGTADQLAYFQPRGAQYEGGSVEVDGSKRWYGWDYAEFGSSPKPRARKVLVWYTDGARRKLRWTCTTYRLARKTHYGEEYRVHAQRYGSRDYPAQADATSG